MRTLKKVKKPCNKCFHTVCQCRFKAAVEKQIEGQVALVNGDNLKQIIEKLLGIIQMILPIQNTGMQM
jgi:hypothetical protein